jgi:hypothetical protein
MLALGAVTQTSAGPQERPELSKAKAQLERATGHGEQLLLGHGLS